MSHQLEDDLKVVHLKVMPFFYGFCLMNGTTDARSFFLLLVRLDVAAQKISRQESSQSLVLELKKKKKSPVQAMAGNPSRPRVLYGI